MRIAITGSNGYIGSRLVAELSKEHEVLELNRQSKDYHFELGNSIDLNGMSIDCVIHCAHSFKKNYGKIDENLNIVGTRILLNDLLIANINQIIFLSSLSAHEKTKSQYGKTKYGVERLISDSGMGVSLRLGMVTSSELGGFAKNLVETIKKFPKIPWPIPKKIFVHETPTAMLISRVKELLDPNPIQTRVEPCYVQEAQTLRNFIVQKSGLKKIYFIPMNLHVLYLGALCLEKLIPNMNIRADSIKSFF